MDALSNTLYRLSAFTTDPAGGNPAGVWIGDALPDAAEMQRIAAEVGFSETAFVAPASGTTRTVRYFSPEAEVPFCGHATIAAGVQVGKLDGPGTYRFETQAGRVPVAVRMVNDHAEAALTSVATRHVTPPPDLLENILDALGWQTTELNPALPPACAYAGAWHLVIAAATPERLGNLDYDFERAKRLMQAADLVTLQLVWWQSPTLFHSRNPFPVGGVVEDPATGAAAAALGGYLRDAKLIETPATVEIRQGEAMGRPSKLMVEIPSEGGIVVRGNAVQL